MNTLWQDIRYSTLQLLRHRTTSVIAVLTLAVGIGANTSVLSLVNATLYKPVNARDPGRLVWLAPRAPHAGRYRVWSYQGYREFERNATAYDGVLTFGDLPLSLGGESPERIRGLVVSGNYFNTLGVRLSAGRPLSPADDGAPGASPVIVISHRFWIRHFGGDSSALGRTIALNRHPYTIVGIAADGFNGTELGETNDLWAPIAQTAQLSPAGDDRLTNADAAWLRVMGRLKPAVSMERAQTEASAIARRMQPDSTPADRQQTMEVLAAQGGLDPSNRRELAPILALLAIVPLLVLLVACANVANIFIARALARRKELAVRQALGSSRVRLMRLILTECLLLAIAAGVTGTLLASWITALIVHFANLPSGVAPALVPDARVFAVTAVLAIVSGLLFGMVPALVATGTSLSPALKNEGMTVGRSRHRLRDAFVIAQASVSLVLLITAGLFLRSLGKALDVSPGFDVHRAVAVSFDVTAEGYTAEARETFRYRLLDDVRRHPGIESAALANVLPLSERSSGTSIVRDGAADDAERTTVLTATVSDGYFGTMRIPMVAGRDFGPADTRASQPVAIVNETLARQLWPGETPIGKHVRASSREPWREVIGIAHDGKYRTLVERPANFYYLPASQDDLGSDVTLVARASGGDAAATISTLRAAFAHLDPSLPVFRVTTLEGNIGRVLDDQRAGAALLGVFGALALVLTALGIYGVVAHGVTLRTREIGIRMSLGARATNVVSHFVREGLALTLIGAGIGVVASGAISGLLAKFLYGLTPTDVLTFALGAAVLCATALVASFVPARRAARIDPMIALRSE